MSLNAEYYGLAFGAPGQGWQGKDMDAPLRSSAVAGRVFDQSQQIFGFNVRELCALGETGVGITLDRNSQAAMGTVMAAAIEDLAFRLPDVDEAIEFSVSLGAYGAYLRAGVFDAENMLRAMQMREEMTLAQQNGAMGLVLGLERDRFYSEFAAGTKVSIAVQYASNDFAIAGETEEVKEVLRVIDENKRALGRVRVFSLPIPNSFHHEMLAGVADEFGRFLASEIQFNAPRRPIILNTGHVDEQGEYVQIVTPTTDNAVEILRQELVVQMTQPARIDLVRQELEQRGIAEVIEPSDGALAKVFRRLGSTMQIIPAWKYGREVEVV